jgi:hypothetical protein
MVKNENVFISQVCFLPIVTTTMTLRGPANILKCNHTVPTWKEGATNSNSYTPVTDEPSFSKCSHTLLLLLF